MRTVGNDVMPEDKICPFTLEKSMPSTCIGEKCMAWRIDYSRPYGFGPGKNFGNCARLVVISAPYKNEQKRFVSGSY